MRPICDLGGGIGLFSVGCAAYGFERTVLVDDFDDPVNHRYGETAFDLHKALGVEIHSADLVRSGMNNIYGDFDIITSFDSMEHWHHSPKILFHEAIHKLKPGGVFFLGVPNCVNLRKRITVPFGIGPWSSIADWYEPRDFRGHVREPDVSDLRYIGRDLGLLDVVIIGRNWLGHYSSNRAIRVLSQIFYPVLDHFPSLCSDIYLVGRKP